MDDKLWSVDPGRGLGVLRLGAPLAYVRQSLAEVGIDLEEDDDHWLYVDDLDTELIFTTTKPPVLREIVVEDDRVRFGPLPVIGQRLHQVVELLQVPDGETLWRLARDDEPDRPPGGNRPPEWTPSDEWLLDQGTLWITSLGLGLSMVRGEIASLRLREPAGSPKRGIGSLTPAQRELSRRSNLATLLLRSTTPAAQARSWFQSLSRLAVFVALGLLMWQAIGYQQRWNVAPVAEGEVVEVRPLPPDPFPMEFVVAYRDHNGGAHQAVFKRADIYTSPAIGEKVEVRYLPEAPDQPLGPARYRDIAFEKFVPWAIGIVAAYTVLQLIVSLASWGFRR